jgi:hypothetical protein
MNTTTENGQRLKAEELRIGNYLDYFLDEDDIDWSPTGMDWQDFKWISEEPDGFNNFHRPIELTEEWLLRFGWEKKGPYKWDNDLMYDYLMTYPSGYTMNGVAYEIKYVHQLQNLYFALTNSELTLKETVNRN